jgi:chorismate dehydratase
VHPMAEKKIKVSVVNYTNSLPFVYGLEHYSNESDFILEKDIPSVCAKKLITNQIDIGLIPVAVIPELKEHYLVSDFCIGAKGKVASVLLVSQVPLSEIKTILLDFHSRTSVQLVQVLSAKYWNIAPIWKNAQDDFVSEINGTTAAVIIGDRTFDLKNRFKYSYDLAEQWNLFTGLPFVFACWVANKKLPELFLSNFSKALKFGLEHKNKVIEALEAQSIPGLQAAHYLNTNIRFELDAEMKKGMNLFLSFLKSPLPLVTDL